MFCGEPQRLPSELLVLRVDRCAGLEQRVDDLGH